MTLPTDPPAPTPVPSAPTELEKELEEIRKHCDCHWDKWPRQADRLLEIVDELRTSNIVLKDKWDQSHKDACEFLHEANGLRNELTSAKQEIEELRKVLFDSEKAIDDLLVFGHQYTQTPLYKEIAVQRRIRSTLARALETIQTKENDLE